MIKPSVLFVGIYSADFNSDSMVRAFRELGYDVAAVNWQSIRYTNGTDYLNHFVLSEAKRVSPEFVFMHIQNPDAIYVETFSELQKIAPVVHYTFDIRLEIVFSEWYKKIAKLVSLTCFACDDDVADFKKEGIDNVIRIHSSCDMDVYKPFPLPIEKINQYPEIVFIGNNHSRLRVQLPLAHERVGMVQFMEKAFGARFGAFGIGWNNSKNIYAQEEALVYNSCKIAITHNHFELDGYCSDRSWRAMACGAFTIHRHYQGVDKDLYWPTTWKTFEELEKQCNRALNDPLFVMQIKKSNTYETRTKHRWKDRFEKIIKTLKTNAVT